jgi:uncharacterized membrane protein
MNIDKNYYFIIIIFLIYLAIDYNLIVNVFGLNKNWNNFLVNIVPQEYINQGQVKFNPLFGLLGWFSVAIGIYYFLYEKLDNVYNVLFYSLIFTIVVYGTFDMTLLAIMPNYPYQLALLDMFNGLLSITMTSFVLYFIKKLI